MRTLVSDGATVSVRSLDSNLCDDQFWGSMVGSSTCNSLSSLH
jgi:hypothetical protein